MTAMFFFMLSAYNSREHGVGISLIDIARKAIGMPIINANESVYGEKIGGSI
jgi:hypothetical protein